MPKPSTARPVPAKPSLTKPSTKSFPEGPPAIRVRAIKTGHNEYTVVEETFATAPTAVKVLKEKSDGAGAQYRCRLWLEQHLGPNRLGGTGLE